MEDLIHVEQLKRELWRPGVFGRASVMVGAGFSLNAAPKSAGAPQFMTWRDLSARMQTRIGASGRSLGTSDMLRLASEFECVLGAAALEQLIRDAVPDEHHEPGRLHQRLLDLPWADIFTTNYDTLLERARPSVITYRYDLVCSIADIPNGRRPRIVKLHGSLPSHRPFIITEDHFRTYPHKFSPLVNLVQQTIMETTLCLIGFSGDDPNFLQWSGWVRDNLGPSAPVIYFVTLDVGRSTRQLLESRRIVPIELGQKFPRRDASPTRHAQAIAWFLDQLHSGKPSDPQGWPGSPTFAEATKAPSNTTPNSSDSKDAQASAQGSSPELLWEILEPGATVSDGEIEAAVERWKHDREEYPGWTCPSEASRKQLFEATRPWLYERAVARLKIYLESRRKVEGLRPLFEIHWRLSVSMQPPPSSLVELTAAHLRLVNPFPRKVSLPGTPELRPDDAPPAERGLWESAAMQWVSLALVILRDAREELDEARFQEWKVILSPITDEHPDWNSGWNYECAAFALSKLSGASAVAALHAWPSRSLPPHWRGRRAALLAEAGLVEEAVSETKAALAAVQAIPQPEGNHRAISEEAWLLWLAEILHDSNFLRNDTAMESSPNYTGRLKELRGLGYDPKDDFHLRCTGLQQATSSQPSGEKIVQQFDPGYAQRVHIMSGRDGSISEYAWAILSTFDDGGIPHSVRRTRVQPTFVSLAAEVTFDHLPITAISLLVRQGQSDVLDRLISRAAVASAPEGVISSAYSLLASAVREALATQRGNGPATPFLAQRVLETCPEVISRLVIRLSEAMLRDAFDLALALHASVGLRDSRTADDKLRPFFRRLFEVATPSLLAEWLPKLVELPVLGSPELPRSGPWGWPEPFFELEQEPVDLSGAVREDDAWRLAIDRLLELTDKDNTDARTRSIRRLRALHHANLLSPSQMERFGDALWAHQEKGLPANTGLLPAAFLSLPSPKDVNRLERVAGWILSFEIDDLIEDMGGGKKGMSGGRVVDAANALNALIGSTRSAFYDENAHRLSWNDQLATKVLDVLSGWVQKNLGSLPARHEEMARPVRLRTALVLASIAISDATEDVRQRAMSVLNSLGGGAIPVEVSPTILVFDSGAIDKLTDQLMLSLSSSDREKRDLAATAIGRWLRLVPRVARPPEYIVDLLFSRLTQADEETLSTGLELVANLIRLAAVEVPSHRVKIISSVLEELFTRTRLPAPRVLTIAEGVEVAKLLPVRPAAASAAAALKAHLLKHTKPVPEILERWLNAAAEDPLPEVRAAASARKS